VALVIIVVFLTPMQIIANICKIPSRPSVCCSHLFSSELTSSGFTSPRSIQEGTIVVCTCVVYLLVSYILCNLRDVWTPSRDTKLVQKVTCTTAVSGTLKPTMSTPLTAPSCASCTQHILTTIHLLHPRVRMRGQLQEALLLHWWYWR
jgi:hypothetical protein